MARYAATSFFDQLNSVWSIHMRCRMTASLGAMVTVAFSAHFAWRASSPKLLTPRGAAKAGVETANRFDLVS
jgi:hypothetical protein